MFGLAVIGVDYHPLMLFPGHFMGKMIGRRIAGIPGNRYIILIDE
jgi:hypothetical protein